jgi:outer membrane receptor protein involved in Fe transport
MYLNFTHLLDAEVIVDEAAQDMNYVRDYNASFGLDFRNFKGWSARLNGRYIGQRNEDNWLYTLNYTTWERTAYQTADGEDIRPELINEDILRSPAFLIFDISLSYTLKEKYMFALKADNIFDDNYTEKDAYYMPGRVIIGSFVYKF